MSDNFPTLDNPYATMAQGAYPDGPKVFPFWHYLMVQKNLCNLVKQ